ncbi:MAG: universal stress protein [Cyanobacteria bacterium P01_D01_bin.128]
MMFKRILVAIDSSETRTESIFQQAIALAKNSADARLMLLHVLCSDDPSNPGLPMRTYSVYYPPVEAISWQNYQKHWDDYERRWLERLQNLSNAAIAAGIPAEFTEVSGEPGKQICSLAHNWEADLIIVGSRGRRGIKEWLLGSVSNYVMHHAPCSVLLAQSPAQPPGNIVEDVPKNTAQACTATAI